MAIEVPDVGYRPTLGESIRRAAGEFPDVDFIVMPDRRMTFTQAQARSIPTCRPLGQDHPERPPSRSGPRSHRVPL